MFSLMMTALYFWEPLQNLVDASRTKAISFPGAIKKIHLSTCFSRTLMDMVSLAMVLNACQYCARKHVRLLWTLISSFFRLARSGRRSFQPTHRRSEEHT